MRPIPPEDQPAGVRGRVRLADAGALGVAYAALAVLVTWPLALHLATALPGYANVDALDTLHLRGAVADLVRHPGAFPRSTAAFWPVGFPVLAFVPNLLDHLLAAPFVLTLPFPVGDGLFWIALVMGNGLAGHVLGYRLGGRHGAGFLAGVAWATSDALLREANLLHGPTLLAPFLPLFLSALLRALEEPEPGPGSGGGARRGWTAGALLALAGLAYWYHALFLLAGSAGLVVARWQKARRLWPGLILAAVLAAPLLLPYLCSWDALPVLGALQVPSVQDAPAALSVLPEDQRFVALHGSDPLLLFRATPIDRSNRVGWVLLLAAGLGAWRTDRRTRWGLLVMAAVGFGMALGPYLKWGEAPVLVEGRAISLPFRWVGSLHPVLGRLHWPERWGILIPLALAALAARAPRPGILAGVLLVEGWLLSGNLPLATQDVGHLVAWRDLSTLEGAVVEVPIGRRSLDASLPALHRRFHGRPMANGMLLPPGTASPEGWEAWMEAQPVLSWIRRAERGETDPLPEAEDVRALAAAGVGAIALDADPEGAMNPRGVSELSARLATGLGPFEDRGALLVWWLEDEVAAPPLPDDPVAWRAAREEAVRRAPPLDRPTLIRAYRGAHRPIR
ncbi:MAG: hypothetical protein JXB39_05635 [Deltaproteobacteria bacterium]|nr:hypothetical protein [Deltaproteobacteria bacterium]